MMLVVLCLQDKQWKRMEELSHEYFAQWQRTTTYQVAVSLAKFKAVRGQSRKLLTTVSVLVTRRVPQRLDALDLITQSSI
jgi:hypothetical protein